MNGSGRWSRNARMTGKTGGLKRIFVKTGEGDGPNERMLVRRVLLPVLLRALLVPHDRLAQPVLQRRAGDEFDLIAGTRHIETSPRLAVRLAWVPRDRALKAGQLRHQLRQRLDRDLPPATKVHRLGRFVLLHRQHDAFGAIFDIQKLTAYRAGAPGLDLLLAPPLGFHALADQRRNDVTRVQIEI